MLDGSIFGENEALPGVTAAAQTPAAPGAYVLVIDLAAPLTLTNARADGHVLPPGTYAYCGSAGGPGGLRARIARHLRQAKPLRWHVDALTVAGRVVSVGWTLDVTECALLGRVLALPGSRVPVPGFGSSDCRRCPAHLVTVAAGFDPGTLSLVRVQPLRTVGGAG